MDCGSQRDKAKIVAYMVCGNSYKEKAGRGETCPVRERGYRSFQQRFCGRLLPRETMLRCTDGIRHNFGRISKNQTYTCPIEDSDNQSHGCPKRKTEKRAEARGGAKRFSGDSRAPAPVLSGRGSLWSEAGKKRVLVSAPASAASG